MLLNAVDQQTPEDEIAAQVESVKEHPRHRDWLVGLLPEQVPVYAGRSTNAAIRIKGYVLAAFEQVGLPAAALPYVLDELENGRAPYVVAAAAKAVRGLDPPAAQVVPYLLKAIENVRYVDDALSFDGYWARWPNPDYTTAVDEILLTILWLGPEAAPARSALQVLAKDRNSFSERARTTLDSLLARLEEADVPPGESHACCHGMVDAAPTISESRRASPALPLDVEMEDQDGRLVRFDQLVRGRPSIVAFFYTRCQNPNKCSLTITKLGRLQQALEDEGLQHRVATLGITYDTDYDVPARLREYGKSRGLSFSASHRLARAKVGFDALRQYFDLGVNFGPVLVNVHRIELFVLDDEGRIASTFARLQWDPDEVLHQARALVVDPDGRGRPRQA